MSLIKTFSALPQRLFYFLQKQTKFYLFDIRDNICKFIITNYSLNKHDIGSHIYYGASAASVPH